MARTGSVTRAAGDVHLAQSSVSDQIQALEAELGAALFTRSKQGLELSPAGEVLKPYAEELLRLAEEARGAVDAVADRAGGLVRIGALETIAATRLPEWLAPFRRDHPDIGFSIVVAGSGALLRQVADGDVDVAFRFDQPGLDERLATRKISSEDLVLIAAPGAAPIVGDLAALAGAAFVAIESGCAYRRLFDTAFDEAGVAPPRPAAEVASMAAIARLVAKGMGLALVPRLAVAEALARGELAEAPWPGPRRTASLAMVWRRRRVQPEPLKRLLAASGAFAAVRPADGRPRHAAPFPS